MNQKLELTTDRLKLRTFKTEDWERLHSYAVNPDFSKYELWGPNSEDDSKKYVNDVIAQANAIPRFKFEFAVTLKESGLLIGGCGIRRETEHSQIANLGWAIYPDFQNKGFATECAKTLIDYGFSELKLALIYATCDTRNNASFKVMEKVGMKRVGMIKGTQEVKGYMRDSYRYELLRA